MQLRDFLDSRENRKRILIVSDISRGQALIRNFEKESGKPVRNVVCKTLGQLIKQIYVYIESKGDIDLRVKIIDRMTAQIVFQNMILDNIESLKYFNNEDILDLKTTKEIFNKVNLIRENGWTGDYENAIQSSCRLSDLRFLADQYEQYLDDRQLIDDVMMLRYVIRVIKSWTDKSEILDKIFASDIYYLSEDINTLKADQLEFLHLVQDNNSVELYTDNPALESIRSNWDRISFYKGYGSFNEAGYIANDIVKRKLPFGTVTIVYNSKEQLPAIMSVMKGNGITVSNISNYSAKDNAYLSLARSIILWAKNNFSERLLENIFSSSVISVNTDNQDVYSNYYRVVTDAANRRNERFILGCGYERNIDFINHERIYGRDDCIAPILDMYSDLIGIFGSDSKKYTGNINVNTVFKKLVKFLGQYTKGSPEYAIGLESIKKLSVALEADKKDISLDKVLDYIDESLQDISIKDPISADSVQIQRFDDWILLDRPNIYIIGLSLNEMQGNTTESPVMSDNEMIEYLGNGYKPTIKNNSELKALNWYRTLNTFSGSRLVFGYSSYNTVAFCANNPSSFYRELLQIFSEASSDEIMECVYGNPKESVSISEDINVLHSDGCEVRLKTSNSDLEKLLACPREYAYSRILNIPDNQYAEIKTGKWLDAKHKGTFFHEIAEEYAKSRLIKEADICYEEAADRELIEQIADKIKEKMLIEVPVAVKGDAELEVRDIVENAEGYFDILQNDLIDTQWRVLSAEQAFCNSKFVVESFTSKSYEFILSGIIDRIDYKTDENDKTIYLRIVDYKTGNKDNKQTADRIGDLIQYTVYENALMNNGFYKNEQDEEHDLLKYVLGNIAKLEHIDNIDEWKTEFVCFQYVFPMDTKDKEPIELKKENIESISMLRLKMILTMLEKEKIYPTINVFKSIAEEYETEYSDDAGTIGYLLDEIEKNDKKNKECSYCSYVNLCSN